MKERRLFLSAVKRDSFVNNAADIRAGFIEASPRGVIPVLVRNSLKPEQIVNENAAYTINDFGPFNTKYPLAVEREGGLLVPKTDPNGIIVEDPGGRLLVPETGSNGIIVEDPGGKLLVHERIGRSFIDTFRVLDKAMFPKMPSPFDGPGGLDKILPKNLSEKYHWRHMVRHFEDSPSFKHLLNTNQEFRQTFEEAAVERLIFGDTDLHASNLTMSISTGKMQSPT